MKKMTIIMVAAVVLIAVVFVGCRFIRGQILDGPGMERDTTDYPVKEPVDSLNKEITAASDGFSY